MSLLYLVAAVRYLRVENLSLENTLGFYDDEVS